MRSTPRGPRRTYTTCLLITALALLLPALLLANPASTKLETQLVKQGKELKVLLYPDLPLQRVAGALAQAGAKGQVLDDSVVRDALWQAGIADYRFLQASVTASPERLVDSIARALLARQGVEWANFNRIGVGASRDAEGNIRYAVVATRRLVELTSDLGAHLQFQVLGGVSKPRLVVSAPDGKVYEGEVVQGSSDATVFAAAVPRGPGGLYKSELLVEGPAGTEIALVFGVHRDPPEDETALVNWEDVRHTPPDERLRAYIRSERQRAKLPPLELNVPAQSVALFHCREMRDQGVAHKLGSGDPAARMAVAGINFGRVTENVVLADSIEEAHLLVMASPAHRANVLDKRVSHYGVAVVDGAPTYPGKILVTELFFRPIDFLGSDDLEIRAEVVIQRLRQVQGLPSLRRRGLLNEAAHARLQGAIKARDPRVDVPEARALMEKARFQYGQVGEVLSELMVIENVEDLAQREFLANSAFDEYGLAIVQPNLPGTPGNGRVWVVLVAIERGLER